MHTDQSLHALPGTVGEATVTERDGGGLSHLQDKVFDAVEYVVTWGLEHRRLGQIDLRVARLAESRSASRRNARLPATRSRSRLTRTEGNQDQRPRFPQRFAARWHAMRS